MSGHAAGNLRGSLFMVLAMAAFALEDMLYKSVTLALPMGQGLVLFGVLGMALFTLLCVLRGQPPLVAQMWRPGLLLRSGFEVLGRLFFALALAFGDLSTTAAILQALPLAVTLGAVLFLREAVGWRRWLAIWVGFFGVLLVIRPTTQGVAPEAIFALLGMVGFAGRDLATRAAPPSIGNLQLGVLGFGMVILAGLVLMLAFGEAPSLPSGQVWGLLIGAALFGVLAYHAVTVAMRVGQVAVVAPFRYSRLVFAMGLGALVFGERPDLQTWLGAALIVGSGLFTLLASARGPRK